MSEKRKSRGEAKCKSEQASLCLTLASCTGNYYYSPLTTATSSLTPPCSPLLSPLYAPPSFPHPPLSGHQPPPHTHTVCVLAGEVGHNLIRVFQQVVYVQLYAGTCLRGGQGLKGLTQLGGRRVGHKVLEVEAADRA